MRISPGDDATTVIAARLRAVIGELTRAGHHRASEPDVLIVLDAGYDVARLAWLLADLPVTLVDRLRSDRVFYAPAGARRGPTKGRAPRHGPRLVLADPATHPALAVVTGNGTSRYGRIEAKAFGQMHPKLESRGGLADRTGSCPSSRAPSWV